MLFGVLTMKILIWASKLLGLNIPQGHTILCSVLQNTTQWHTALYYCVGCWIPLEENINLNYSTCHSEQGYACYAITCSTSVACVAAHTFGNMWRHLYFTLGGEMFNSKIHYNSILVFLYNTLNLLVHTALTLKTMNIIFKILGSFKCFLYTFLLKIMKL